MAFNDAMELVEKAVQDAEDYQSHLEHNKESMKLIKIVEDFRLYEHPARPVQSDGDL